MTYLNLPTLEQIEKWQQRWKQAKPMIELRSEIYRTDKRIALVDILIRAHDHDVTKQRVG